MPNRPLTMFLCAEQCAIFAFRLPLTRDLPRIPGQFEGRTPIILILVRELHFVKNLDSPSLPPGSRSHLRSKSNRP